MNTEYRAVSLSASDGSFRKFLLKDPATYLYFLGDMDEPFATCSQFAGLVADRRLCGAALLYEEKADAVVLAAGDGEAAFPEALDLLGVPDAFSYHLPVSFADRLRDRYDLTERTEMVRMRLSQNPSTQLDPACRDLSEADGAKALTLSRAVPEIWFSERQFENNRFVGLFREDRLAAMAGTHVTSLRQGVAAIGSVGVHPDHRRRGYGRRVLAALLTRLGDGYSCIGLNVAAKNEAALHLYESLGFRREFAFETGAARRKPVVHAR